MLTLPVARVHRGFFRTFPMDAGIGLADVLRHVIARGRCQREARVQLERPVQGFGRTGFGSQNQIDSLQVKAGRFRGSGR